MLEELFKRFIKEKTFLQNVSPKTVLFYQHSFNAFKRVIGEEAMNKLPDRFTLSDFIIALRQSDKMTVGGINVYIRGINSFLSWLWENNLLNERLRIKELKNEQKVIETYSEAQIKSLVLFKPKKPSEHRTHALVCLLLDTGARIEEALTLKRESVDFDNLLIKVRGKGSKERILPISIECRKVLFRYLQRHKYEYIFSTKSGSRLTYRNAVRDLALLAEKAGIGHTNFHMFRHTFATEYLRNGGGEIYLQHLLGHTTLQMTKRYTHINSEDLKRAHAKLSILERVR